MSNVKLSLSLCVHALFLFCFDLRKGRHFLSKVSAKRMLENRVQHHAHDLWKVHGLGLQDAYGGIRLGLPCLTRPTTFLLCLESRVSSFRFPLFIKFVHPYSWCVTALCKSVSGLTSLI